MTSRVLIAGAGIGGLTAALALARRGIDVVLFEQAEQFSEAGAGIQLSPNATAVLAGLDLAAPLAPMTVAPEAIRLRAARSGRPIATLPLGAAALARLGAPYWVAHRADLQKALLDAATGSPHIALRLGARLEGHVVGSRGVRARIVRRRGNGVNEMVELGGTALIGADGLWSGLRAQLGMTTPPRFAGRSAWRALVPAVEVAPQFRQSAVDLWLGPRAHLVHYPVRGGAAVNIVAVATDRRESGAWAAPANRDEVLGRFPARAWAREVRDLLAVPDRWQTWALYDLAPLPAWGAGPVTLIGDAAHPMLPFLAQGAAMAIEDAAVLAGALARSPGDPASALRAYETARRQRTAQAQRAARRNDLVYHLPQPAAMLRNATLRALGGERLLAQYDWIYRWRA